MDHHHLRGYHLLLEGHGQQLPEHRINIIDTPGHVDFTIEVERSLRVLDGACAVFCAVGGVEPQSETVWRQADKYGVPRLAFVNKMDRMGANFLRVVGQVKERLGSNAVPIQLPDRRRGGLQGRGRPGRDEGHLSGTRSPGDELRARGHPGGHGRLCSEWREDMIEAAAEANDEVMEKYLEGGELTKKRSSRVCARAP